MPAPRGNKNGRRFQKGNSGGPGRPKGYRAPTTIIRDFLSANPDRADRIVTVAIERAEDGDFQFFKYLCDRLDGIPAQSINVSGEITTHLKVIERVKGKK